MDRGSGRIGYACRCRTSNKETSHASLFLVLMPPPAVIGYARVSTAMQVKDGISLDTQRDRIAAYATLKGMPLTMYVDEGISGKEADNRPALLRALAALRKDDVFCVYDLSRFARNTAASLAMLEQIQRVGAHFCSVQQQMDTTTPSGEMMFTLLSTFNHYERRMIATKVSDNMRHLSAIGKLGKKPPFGWRWVAKHRPFEPIPEQQAVIERVREWRLKDAALTVGEIVSMLNDDAAARDAHVDKNGKRKTFYYAPVKKWMTVNGIERGLGAGEGQAGCSSS